MSDKELIKIHNTKGVIIRIVKPSALGNYIGLASNGDGAVWLAYENGFFKTERSEGSIITTDYIEYKSN